MKTKNTAVHRYVEISTAHITKETSDKLCQNLCKNETTIFRNIFARKYEYGFYIYILNNNEGEKPPKDLKQIVKYAKKHKADLIILDRDCDTVNELKAYVW